MKWFVFYGVLGGFGGIPFVVALAIIFARPVQAEWVRSNSSAAGIHCATEIMQSTIEPVIWKNARNVFAICSTERLKAPGKSFEIQTPHQIFAQLGNGKIIEMASEEEFGGVPRRVAIESENISITSLLWEAAIPMTEESIVCNASKCRLPPPRCVIPESADRKTIVSKFTKRMKAAESEGQRSSIWKEYFFAYENASASASGYEVILAAMLGDNVVRDLILFVGGLDAGAAETRDLIFPRLISKVASVCGKRR